MATENQRKSVAVAAMAEMYRRELTTTGLKLYVAALADVPASDVEQAIVRAVAAEKWMPTPAELRELAGCANVADRAVYAFSAMESAISAVGSYRSPDFDDPLINAAVRMLGGWERVCGLPVEEFDKWFRKDFLATYETLARTGVNGDADAPLVGIHERTNRGLGYGNGKSCAVRITTGLPWAGERPKRLEAGEHRCSGLLKLRGVGG